MKKNITLLTLLCGFILLIPNTLIANEKAPETNKEVVYDLIQRIIPSKADQFEIAFIPKEDDKDLFEIESVNGKIVLRGNNGIYIASALNYYLKILHIWS